MLGRLIGRPFENQKFPDLIFATTPAAALFTAVHFLEFESRIVFCFFSVARTVSDLTIPLNDRYKYIKLKDIQFLHTFPLILRGLTGNHLIGRAPKQLM